MHFTNTAFAILAAVLRFTVAQSASSANETAISCRADSPSGNQVCCSSSIQAGPNVNTTRVCCDGSVFGSGNSSSTTLVGIYDGLTCCMGDANVTVHQDAGFTACTAGTPTPMASIAVDQGVEQTSTSTSTGGAHRATGQAILGAAGVMGAYAMGAAML